MAELENPPHFDCSVEVTKDKLNKDECFKILKHLKPSWNASDLVCQDLSGGYVNLIIRCYMKCCPDDSVVFRIWANIKENLVNVLDRRMEKDLIHKLGGKGVAPQLYASFNNGICYEYFDGEKLTPSLCMRDDIARLIAKNFAIIHSTKLEEVKLEPLKMIYHGYNGYPYSHPNENKNEIFQASIPTKEEAKKEIEFLEEYIKELQCHIVQCHGDPHAQNMMYNKETGKLIFLDYEVGYIGCQPADITHFFSFLSIDYNDFQNTLKKFVLPEEAFQRKFLRWYLEEWFELKGKHASDVTEKDVERFFIQVNKYLLVLHFYFGMAFLQIRSDDTKEIFHDDIKAVDFHELVMHHFQAYFEKKDFYKSLKLPE